MGVVGNAQSARRESVPARLASRLRSPCVFIVAPSGAGKSTLLRRLSNSAEHAVLVTLGRECRDPAELDSLIMGAMSKAPTMIAVDDVQLVTGTRSEAVLERMVARCRSDLHFVLASRRDLGSDLAHATRIEPDIVTAPELVLRIDEVAESFRVVGGHALPLESASHVASETCGWAGLVHQLALQSRSVGPDSLGVAVDAMLQSDFAAAGLEHALQELPIDVVRSLELTSGLAALDFAECARLLGAPAATRLLDAVDSGAVMHVTELGSRVLPPILRRHLRARAGLPAEIHFEQRSGQSNVATIAGTTIAPRIEPVRSPVASRPAPLDAAMTRLRRGDVVGAVPLLQRVLRMPADASEHSAAHLALLMIREPVTPRETTLDALAALERECVARRLDARARVVRGAVAAASDLPHQAAEAIVEECETRGDDVAAALVAGIDFVMRLRRGHATSVQANGLADRLERLGFMDVAVWARAAEALLAAASGAVDAHDRIVRAQTASIATGVEGARAFIDAARAQIAPGARAPVLMASARRSAMQTGLPRLLPLPPMPALAAVTGGTAPAVVSAEPRRPHVTVRCFGGFHLCADGTEIELRTVRPQARALLRMLALNAGSPLHRELIADILWGDLGIDSAVHALHVSVSSLRRILPTGLIGPAASIVERVGEAYRLGITERHDCDLADFDDQLAQAASSKLRRDGVTTVRGLRSALSLYVGDVLPEDGPAEWVAGARERYRVRAAEAAASLAHLELRFGDAHAAVAAASRAVEIDPWLDESWRTLVLVHRSSGDVVAARRAEDGYRHMRVGLGVE
jgi:DNA-binding SARP family transcriptional activator